MRHEKEARNNNLQPDTTNSLDLDDAQTYKNYACVQAMLSGGGDSRQPVIVIEDCDGGMNNKKEKGNGEGRKRQI